MVSRIHPLRGPLRSHGLQCQLLGSKGPQGFPWWLSGPLYPAGQTQAGKKAVTSGHFPPAAGRFHPLHSPYNISGCPVTHPSPSHPSLTRTLVPHLVTCPSPSHPSLISHTCPALAMVSTLNRRAGFLRRGPFEGLVGTRLGPALGSHSGGRSHTLGGGCYTVGLGVQVEMTC